MNIEKEERVQLGGLIEDIQTVCTLWSDDHPLLYTQQCIYTHTHTYIHAYIYIAFV